MKYLAIFALLGVCAGVASAQSVTVTDTFYLPNGTKYSGNLTISWPVPFTGGDGKQIPSGPPIQVSVNNGALSVPLEANTTATPANTYYSVTYRPAGSSAINETWIVPCCSSPVGLSAVRVAQPPTPSFMIALSQISQSSATNGQVPIWNSASNAWLPGTGGGGGSMAIGGTVSGGTPGDLLFVNTGPVLAQEPTLGATRFPALTGAVTTPGGSLATTLSSGIVGLSNMANLSANSIIGNNTGSPATPLALNGTQTTAMLNNFTTSLKGLVPAPGSVNGYFLQDNGTWGPPGITSIVTSQYNWTPQTPGGTLSSGVTNTISLNPGIVGLSASDTGHYVELQGGTGTAEATLITGGTCTGTTTACTITVVPANNHSGAWTVGPANSGLQEAFNVASASGTPVYGPPGTWPVYAPARMPSQMAFTCAGKFTTFWQAQGPTVGIIDATGTKNRIEHCGFTTTTPQTSGGFFLRMGNCGFSCDNAFTVIQDNYFEAGWDEILGINYGEGVIAHNIFRNFEHTGVTATDSNFVDKDGPWVHHNEFFEQTNTAVALACVYGTSTGGVTIDHNNCYGSSIGSGTGQLTNNIFWNATVSTQLVVDDNVLETFSSNGIAVVGVFNLITITGNTIALPNLTASNLTAISLSGNNTTSSCGTGIGICEVAITGNVIQGPGCPACNSQGIVLSGFISNASIGTNEMSLVQFGIDVGANVTATTVGPQQIQAYGTPLVGAGTGVVWNFSAPTTFANAPGAANGSALYFIDGNSTCAAGSSTGRTCFRENGAWTH